MTDPKTMSDEDLEKSLTDDSVRWAFNLGWHADKETAQEIPTDKKDPDPKWDPKPADKSWDWHGDQWDDNKKPEDQDPDQKDPDPKSVKMKQTQKWIENLLSKNNALKDKVKNKDEIIAQKDKEIYDLKHPKDDDGLTDEQRQEQINEKTVDKKLAESQKQDALDAIKDNEQEADGARNDEIQEVLSEHPDIMKAKDQFLALAKEHPNLSPERLAKLWYAENDPSKLLDEQTINKMKWWFNLAWKYKWEWKAKPASQMTDEELEWNLTKEFSSWKNIFG